MRQEFGHMRFIGVIFLVWVCILLTGIAHSQQTNAKSTSGQRTTDGREKIRTIPLCELVGSPHQYGGKIVRTRAIYVVTLETEFLYDPLCISKDAWVYYKSSDKKAYDELTKYLNEPVSGEARRIKVTIIGRFDGPSQKGYGHLNFARFRFTTMRVESGESASDAPDPFKQTSP